MACATTELRRLLAIYTGGTIGMRSDNNGLVPGQGMAAVLRKLAMFHHEDGAKSLELPEDTLMLPPSSGPKVIYTVLEWQQLFDSSDMTITQWFQIAETIKKHYDQYHGFVVLHGTDTMAYGASMLSFMLENLQKPIIITGAQVPIHALWNDSRENLLGALLIAGQYLIPEVCLFFQNQLFRGNRTTKVDSRRFSAFRSPNLPPLATLGADTTINWDLVRKVPEHGQLVVHRLEDNVGVLRLYPGIRASQIRAFLQPPIKGVVLQTFGAGNGPTNSEFLQELRAATSRGILILNCTQCLHGSVNCDYASGTALRDTGLILGYDMTSEAALAKLAFVLGQPGLSLDARKKASGVIKLLRESGAYLSSQELEDVGMELCRLTSLADVEGLQAWWLAGADLGQPGYDGQWALQLKVPKAGHMGSLAVLVDTLHMLKPGGGCFLPILEAESARNLEMVTFLKDQM